MTLNWFQKIVLYYQKKRKIDIYGYIYGQNINMNVQTQLTVKFCAFKPHKHIMKIQSPGTGIRGQEKIFKF